MKKIKCLLFVVSIILMLFANFELNVQASSYNTSDGVEILSGEFKNEGNKGIRFEAYVDGFKLSGVDYYGIELAYGSAKANKDFVIGGTVNDKKVVNVEVNTTNKGFYYLNLYNIPETAYAQMVSARAYVIIGEEVYYSNNIICKII